jgi:hypothetical protein
LWRVPAGGLCRRILTHLFLFGNKSWFYSSRYLNSAFRVSVCSDVGPSQRPQGLRRGSGAFRLQGFRFRIWPGQGCPSLLSVVSCQVEVSATSWSLIRRSLTECGVSECDLENSTTRRFRPTKAVGPWKMCPMLIPEFSLYVTVGVWCAANPNGITSQLLSWGCEFAPNS